MIPAAASDELRKAGVDLLAVGRPGLPATERG
jgi:hypothetical protein